MKLSTKQLAKPSILIAALIFSFSSLNAMDLTSGFQETVTYTAPVGTVVKKGEVLYKFDDWYINQEIKKLKLNLKIAEADLKDKETDIKRAKVLKDKYAVSIAAYEDVIVNYFSAKAEVEKLKLDIEKKISDAKKYTHRAPNTRIILKELLVPNSGVDCGQPILELDVVNNSKSKTSDFQCKVNDNIVTLTGSYSGAYIKYLPKEGDTVKKGDVLVKYSTTSLKLKLKSKKIALNAAIQMLNDARTDIQRAKILYKEKAMSLSSYENIVYLYTKYNIETQLLKLEIEEKERDIKDRESSFIADSDYLVLKRYVDINSGSEWGIPLLELKKIK